MQWLSRFNTPLLNASGCSCTTHEQLLELSKSQYANGGLITKSMTLYPRNGNLLPRFFADQYGTINSTGLANFGLDYYLDPDLLTQIESSGKPLIHSIAVLDLDSAQQMITKVLDSCAQPIIELNISCPNVDKPILGYHLGHLETLINQLMVTSKTQSNKELIIGLKLPPYLDKFDIHRTANLLLDYQSSIDFITCINGLPNGLLFNDHSFPAIYPNQGLGGIGGIYCKPIGLSNVYQFSQIFRTKTTLKPVIIGCGGVTTAKDVTDYLQAGASLVQVGSSLVQQGPSIFSHLLKES